MFPYYGFRLNRRGSLALAHFRSWLARISDAGAAIGDPRECNTYLDCRLFGQQLIFHRSSPEQA